MSDETPITPSMGANIEVPYRLLAWCYANLRNEALISPFCVELRAAIGRAVDDPRPPESERTCNCRRLPYPHYRSRSLSAGDGCPMWMGTHSGSSVADR